MLYGRVGYSQIGCLMGTPEILLRIDGILFHSPLGSSTLGGLGCRHFP